MMQTHIPDVVDSYSTPRHLPVGITVSVDTSRLVGDATLLVRYEQSRAVRYDVPMFDDVLIDRLPLPPGSPYGSYRLEFVLSDEKGPVMPLVRDVTVTGSDRVYLDSPTLADSLFLRMDLDSSLILEEVSEDGALSYIRRWEEPVLPEFPVVNNVLDNIHRFLCGFELEAMEVEDGMMRVGHITDVLMDRKGTALELALLASNIAWNLGYSPCIAFSPADTCLFGIRVDTLGRPRCHHVEHDTGDMITSIVSGDFVFFDVADSFSFDSAVSSADDVMTGDVTCICDVEFELEREAHTMRKHRITEGAR